MLPICVSGVLYVSFMLTESMPEALLFCGEPPRAGAYGVICVSADLNLGFLLHTFLLRRVGADKFFIFSFYVSFNLNLNLTIAAFLF